MTVINTDQFLFCQTLANQLRNSNFLNQNKCLYYNPFDFRNYHFTNHILTNITEKIRNVVDDCKYACGVFLDF